MQTRPAGRGRTARRLAAVLLSVSATAVAGCGFDVQTNAVYQPAVGSNVRQGVTDVLSAVIVSPKVGQGVFVATLVDSSDTTSDKLTSVTAGGGVTVASGATLPEMPVQTPVNLADTGGIAMTGDAITTVNSNYVRVTLSFAKADPVTINVPVVLNNGPYADLGTTSSAPNSVAANGANGALGGSGGSGDQSSPAPSSSPTGGTQ